ncbi:hypothetical protein DFR24_4096 [Panacagrimonas perspica]|uniref:Uncharacterized protein n=1 Tax=Panacagrimonas perspica TaxID=381431 RepID=A0A4R7NXR1_9GAMM|nr:hypothetical protein [Panacagrimonas perspica]TDU25652.1 hypothetical protein DFR24_4096 [Panacagrimonas perspica]THD03757.1 hypothetical protein B1810_07695 [Panacagrimonas perspica]
MTKDQIDLASIKLTVNAAGAVPDVAVAPDETKAGKGVARCHLTSGARLSLSGARFDPAIVVTASVDVVVDPNDTKEWSFSFLQFANLLVREVIYGGRVENEGSVRINYAVPPAMGKNPSLDSTSELAPFVNLLGSPQSEVKEGNRVRRTLTRTMGDHPNSQMPLVVQNPKTNAPNFLYNQRLDLGLTTVFVGRDPDNKIHPLAHFTWHLIYDAKFSWLGSICTGKMANGRFDISNVVKGAPPDPTLSSLLNKPVGPFYNDLCKTANERVINALSPPNYVSLATRDTGIPKNFYA